MGMPDSGLRDGFGKPWSSGWRSLGLEMEGMGRVAQTMGRMQVLFVVNCAAGISSNVLTSYSLRGPPNEMQTS